MVSVSRGVMTLCCDVTVRYVFCDTHVYRSFFQNALKDHIGICTDTNKTLMTYLIWFQFVINLHTDPGYSQVI